MCVPWGVGKRLLQGKRVFETALCWGEERKGCSLGGRVENLCLGTKKEGEGKPRKKALGGGGPIKKPPNGTIVA